MLLPHQVLLQQQHHRPTGEVGLEKRLSHKLRRVEKTKSGIKYLSFFFFYRNLWKEFQNVSDSPFLSKPRNYGFILTFHFFQPMNTVRIIPSECFIELKQVNSQKLYINLARLKSGYLRMGPKYKQEEYVLPRY